MTIFWIMKPVAYPEMIVSHRPYARVMVIVLKSPCHLTSSFIINILEDSMNKFISLLLIFQLAFADDVNINRGIFTFVWEGAGQEAKKVREKAGKFIRFHWLDDDDDNCYFEFRLEIDDITSEVALIITDFAEEDEMDESKRHTTSPYHINKNI